MDNWYIDRCRRAWAKADAARLQPPARCGILTHDNPQLASSGHPQALDWTGELTWTKGGTAIIRGEKPENGSNKDDST